VRCDLVFTMMSYPGAGPSTPTLPYFVADMPPLPEGAYAITFRVVESYRKHADGTPVADEARRDALATTPFRATFTIGNGRPVAWGDPANGLQAGIAASLQESRRLQWSILP